MATTTQKNQSAGAAVNPPVAKIRIGLLTANIWARTDEKGTFYSITFERRYRDTKGEWHSSFSYNPSDLLALSKLADQAHSKILELKSAEAAAPAASPIAA